MEGATGSTAVKQIDLFVRRFVERHQAESKQAAVNLFVPPPTHTAGP